MREILFRGKRIDNGEWVEGSFLRDGEKHKPINRPELQYSDCYIVPKTDHDIVRLVGTNGIGLNIWANHVDPSTVGQYTGLKDKNGKRIFEGDIVKTQPFSDRPYSRRAKFKQHIGVVEHKTFPKYVSEWSVRIDDYKGFACCDWSAFYECEVIGNIHDNPELIGDTE